MSTSLKLFDLKDQVAIVTGGAGALGKDMADVLASAGAHIIFTSRTPGETRGRVQAITERHGVDGIVLELDQSNAESIARFADEASAWKGRIDVLVNNAAGNSSKGETDFLTRKPGDMADLIATNLTGVMLCCQAVGRTMVRQGRGKIINVASISGLVGRSRSLYRRHGVKEMPVDYAASKAGVLGFTRDLAAYMAPFNVQVNALSPGGFDKGKAPREFVADFAAMTPLGRMGQLGSDIKGATLFLASSASDYITGQNVVVDGGFSAVK